MFCSGLCHFLWKKNDSSWSYVELRPHNWSKPSSFSLSSNCLLYKFSWVQGDGQRFSPALLLPLWGVYLEQASRGCSINLKTYCIALLFLLLFLFCFPVKNLQKILNNNGARKDCCLNLKSRKISRESPVHDFFHSLFPALKQLLNGQKVILKSFRVWGRLQKNLPKQWKTMYK